MRAFAILAAIFAATVGTTSALVDASVRTWVDVKANGYDERDYGSGCTPDGCKPENTRDGNTYGNSRWSCQGKILDSYYDDVGCCITYCFEEPQDIVKIEIAFHLGKTRTRTLDVFNNDDYFTTISSSGTTDDFEPFNLYTDETAELKLCLYDPKWNTDVWLSITEVRILVD